MPLGATFLKTRRVSNPCWIYVFIQSNQCGLCLSAVSMAVCDCARTDGLGLSVVRSLSSYFIILFNEPACPRLSRYCERSILACGLGEQHTRRQTNRADEWRRIKEKRVKLRSGWINLNNCVLFVARWASCVFSVFVSERGAGDGATNQQQQSLTSETNTIGKQLTDILSEREIAVTLRGEQNRGRVPWSMAGWPWPWPA